MTIRTGGVDDGGGLPILKVLKQPHLHDIPTFSSFPLSAGENRATVAARSENVFFGWEKGKENGKKGVQIALHAFFEDVSELKVCSEGTESVSLQSVFLKLVRHAELYAGDAVLVGAIASHIAGHGFPFIIGTATMP